VEQNLAPERAKHTWVNMFHSLHNKEFPDSYKIKGPFDDFQKDVDLLFDTFLVNYNRYLSGEMPLSSEKKCKAFRIPGPSQYRAFNILFSYFKKEEFELLENNYFYYYNSLQQNTKIERGIIEFVENLVNFDFADQDRKVVMCCGTFYSRNLELRERILTAFESLYKKGIEIHIYANCKKREIKGHDEFLKKIRETSSFGLKDRIPIHFIQAGNDYFFIEFPHAEEIIVRLNFFIDLKKMALKDGYKKGNVEQFFNELIKQALE
jgi:hypothetical protein